ATKDQFVLRLTMDGLLDESFGMGGLAMVDINNSDDYLREFILSPDGSSFLLGMTKPGQYVNATITKLTASGQIETSFANNGTFIYTESSLNTHLLSMTLSGTSEILLS